MQFFAICLLLFLPIPLCAQYADLLRNPDITWIAEYTTDFELNPVYNDNLGEEHNLLNVIRITNDAAVNGMYPESEVAVLASRFFLDGLNSGAFECFADSLLQKPVSPEQLKDRINRPDTLPNPNHPMDTVFYINEVHAAEIELFRIRLVVFYDVSKRMLDARMLAVAPMIKEHDEEGNLIGRRPLVWIKMPALKGKAAKKLPKEASYIVQTRMKENAPDLDQATRIKGNFDIQKWAAGEVSKPSHRCLSANIFTPVSTTELTSQLFWRDTLFSSYDDQNNSGLVVIENNLIDQVEKIRFVQNWYFDERRRAFDCRVVAVAPLAAMRDSEGNFRYYKPLFYVKY